MVQRRKMVEGEKLSDQKILMTWSPGVRDERQRQMMLERSQKNTEDDKKTKQSKDTKGKGKARGTPEPVKSDVETGTKGDSYPSKRTRSSGPVTWDCPFCEDKKYVHNLEYLVHLQKAHKCNLPGHAVKKEVKKGKPGKYPKGQGKR